MKRENNPVRKKAEEGFRQGKRKITDSHPDCAAFINGLCCDLWQDSQ